MIAAAQCPQRESLYQYSVGLLSDDQSEEIAVHIDNCSDCQAELLTLSDAGDTLVGELRTPVDEPFLQEARLGDAIAEAILAAPRPSSDRPTESYLGTRRETGEHKMLGEYELLEELGRGGMGRVFKARHTKLDRIVALKILPSGRLEDSRSIARFAREMRAIGQLDHPHVVHAYDGREIDEMPVLVMEYVEGMDLAELVRRLGRLRPADAAELVRQAAEGLQYAHQRGLVHRDIKPSNLMLTRGGMVKLLDLGLARFYSDPVGDEVTGTGQMMGTADYVAPEQVSDSRAADIRADIYSLGCTLYKLLSGRAPFAGGQYPTALDKMNAHVHRPAPPIGAIVPGLPAGLVAVLERMLAKQPEARFATPAEVVEAVRPFCAGADTANLVEQAEQRATATTITELPPAKPVSVAPAPLPMLTTLAARCHCSRQWLVATGVVLLLLGLGFAAGVMITIYKNGEKTQVEVPDGSQVRVGAEGDVEVRPPKAAGASGAAAAMSPLWRIGLAMHEYHDAMSSFPPAVLKGPDGETPYSWRVALLPYLGHEDLYEQYRRDEPWDSPHNLQLLDQIPDVYRTPGSSEDATNTAYFALVGPGTIFPGEGKSRSLREVVDGAVHTILVVEAKREIPWTKPEDIAYDSERPLPELGGFRDGGFHVVFADGSVRFIPEETPESRLRALVSPAQGERVEDLPERVPEAPRHAGHPQPFGGGNLPRATEHPAPPEVYREPDDFPASEIPTAPRAPDAPDAPLPTEADAPPDAPRAPSR